MRIAQNLYVVLITATMLLSCNKPAPERYIDRDVDHPFQFTSMQALSQLAGTWHCNINDSTVQTEYWMRSGQHYLQGAGVRVKGDDTVFTESLRIQHTDSGTYYIAGVSDQNDGAAVAFKLVEYDHFHFHFVNRDHDFPQRILYSISGDSLNATVTNLDTSRKSTFYFVKSAKTQ